MRYSFLLLSVALLCLAGSAEAQQRINYYPDSIRIELPDHQTLVVFEMKQFKKDLDFIRNFPVMFKELLEYVQKSTPANFSSTGPYRIDIQILPEGYKEIMSNSTEHSYKPVGEKTLIKISHVDKSVTQVTVKEKQLAELLPPGWEVFINSKDFKIKIYSESFEGINGIGTEDFTQASSTLSSDPGIKIMGKKSVQARMVVQQGKVSQNYIHYIYPGDNIFLNMNAGIGLFGDKLYPELSFALGLTFKDRFFRQNIRPSIVYNNLFFAEKTTEGFNVNTNSFLSLTLEKNFNRGVGGPHWSGLGAGLLVRKSGDYFTGNTAKFFITHNMGRVNLVPEFYLTDDFKKFAFGMTLKYNF